MCFPSSRMEPSNTHLTLEQHETDCTGPLIRELFLIQNSTTSVFSPPYGFTFPFLQLPLL